MPSLAAKVSPFATTGLFAAMIDGSPLWFTPPAFIVALGVTAYAHRGAIIDEVPWFARFRAPPMPFDELVRHVAIKSRWAVTFNKSESLDWGREEDWRVALRSEICRPLISGEISAKGILRPDGGTGRENHESPIDQSFWRTASFRADLIMMTVGEPGGFANGTVGGAKAAYLKIMFDRASVLRVWPARTRRERMKNPSPFVGWGVGLWHMMQEQLTRIPEEERIENE